MSNYDSPSDADLQQDLMERFRPLMGRAVTSMLQTEIRVLLDNWTHEMQAHFYCEFLEVQDEPWQHVRVFRMENRIRILTVVFDRSSLSLNVSFRPLTENDTIRQVGESKKTTASIYREVSDKYGSDENMCEMQGSETNYRF